MTTKQKTEREVLEMALVGYNQQLVAVEQKIAEVKAQLGVKSPRLQGLGWKTKAKKGRK